MSNSKPKKTLTETEERARLNIVMRRRGLGYTIEDVAHLLDVSIAFLGRIEAGSERVNLRHLDNLAQIFGCDVSELLKPNKG
jgi:transcriptional regulator with XRE-family HTH domain